MCGHLTPGDDNLPSSSPSLLGAVATSLHQHIETAAICPALWYTVYKQYIVYVCVCVCATLSHHFPCQSDTLPVALLSPSATMPVHRCLCVFVRKTEERGTSGVSQMFRSPRFRIGSVEPKVQFTMEISVAGLKAKCQGWRLRLHTWHGSDGEGFVHTDDHFRYVQRSNSATKNSNF